MIRRDRVRSLVLLPVLVALVSLSACGVPKHNSATETDPTDVPFGLLDENSGVDPRNQLGSRDVVVFLAKNNRLVRAPRKLAPPVTLERLLDVLAQGPTRAEVADGTRSALPDDETFESVELIGGTAFVDLTGPFTQLSANDQVLALAQIVWTLTARPGVGLVQFTRQETAIEIPRADGSLTSSPVSRDEYQPQAPTT